MEQFFGKAANMQQLRSA